jgi:uncharacterized protein DUF4291
MTWIKPSFCWMMYRSGWARKEGQERILGIDISREGFEWALAHSCLTAYEPATHGGVENWRSQLQSSPVRIQWDPERTLLLQPLESRTIQIGLSGPAVSAYLDDWITQIVDLTPFANQVESLVHNGNLAEANALLPIERPYPLDGEVARRVGCQSTT